MTTAGAKPSGGVSAGSEDKIRIRDLWLTGRGLLQYAPSHSCTSAMFSRPTCFAASHSFASVSPCSVSKSMAKPLSDNYSRPAVSGAMNGARAMHGCAGPGLLSDNPYPARLTPARVWAMTDDKLDIKTYSLSEVAEMVLPSDMTNGIRWISRQRSKPSG